MSDHILVLNAGSSSLKFALYPVDGDWKALYRLRGELEGIGHAPRLHARTPQGPLAQEETLFCPDPRSFGPREAVAFLLEWLSRQLAPHRLVGAGHRVVHGGRRFSAPVLITPEVMDELQQLVPLARLHEPWELEAIRTLSQARPDLPQVACFDTAFHATQPEVARRFALPRHFHDEGVKRYGFHGLSYEYATHALPELVGERALGRVVVAHLGNGASLCALRELKSIATTMGFTALDGLVMGTRPGALDPGVLLYLIQERHMTVEQVSDLLYFRSGLLGVSGISHDMRALLASPDVRAQEAVELFVYRVVREVGSLAAALGGLDVLAFSGGIGERSPEIRERICAQLAWLGIKLDPDANRAGGPLVSTAASPVPVCVVHCNEELVIARHTCRLLQQQGRIVRRRSASSAPAPLR